MKGLLENVAFVVILLLVLVVGSQIIKNIGYNTPKIKINSFNVTLTCLNLNNTDITLDDLTEVIYGFITEKCDDFYARTSQKITRKDIERIVSSINKNIKVVKIENCNFPSVNVGYFYVNFDFVDINRKIYINRKNIINSDILMCIV